MKKTTFTTAALITAHATFAQVTIAPEAGLNLAKVTISQKGDFVDISSVAGLKLGTCVNVPVTRGLFFQPGIFYAAKGFKSERSDYAGTGYTFNSKVNANYIEVLLNLGYTYSLGKAGGLFVTAGPYTGCGIGGKVVDAMTMFGQTYTVPANEAPKVFASGDSTITLMRRKDLGLNFSLGYQSSFGIYARFQYGLGLTNITKEPLDGNVRNRCIGISVGYAFKIGK